MRIDATIFAALDAGTLTIDRFLESLGPVFDHVERKALIDATVAAVAAGYANEVIKLMIDEGAHHLPRAPQRPA